MAKASVVRLRPPWCPHLLTSCSPAISCHSSTQESILPRISLSLSRCYRSSSSSLLPCNLINNSRISRPLESRIATVLQQHQQLQVLEESPILQLPPTRSCKDHSPLTVVLLRLTPRRLWVCPTSRWPSWSKKMRQQCVLTLRHQERQLWQHGRRPTPNQIKTSNYSKWQLHSLRLRSSNNCRNKMRRQVKRFSTYWISFKERKVCSRRPLELRALSSRPCSQLPSNSSLGPYNR